MKASISLTVVMGITWIIGVLVIEIEELFALAYIFTIFVAFQGVFIFVIFVLFSKQVKESYAKWWKAKVAESDFLSKHFGSKSLTTGTGLVSKLSIKLNIRRCRNYKPYLVFTNLYLICRTNYDISTTFIECSEK